MAKLNIPSSVSHYSSINMQFGAQETFLIIINGLFIIFRIL